MEIDVNLRSIIFFFVMLIAINCNAEDAPGLEAQIDILSKVVPEERKNQLDLAGTSAEKLVYATYATSLPISVTGASTEGMGSQWILPEETNLLSIWPLEMIASLTESRKRQIKSLTGIGDLSSAVEVMDAIRLKMNGRRGERLARLEKEEALIDKSLLPFDMNVLLYVRFLADSEEAINQSSGEKKGTDNLDDVGAGSENKADISGVDLALLTEIVNITRRLPGELPPDREDAIKRVRLKLADLSGGTAAAVLPSIHYAIGNMYWSGWGEGEKRELALAQEEYKKAAEAMFHKLSIEGLAFYTTAANVANDGGHLFVKYYNEMIEFKNKGTIESLFEGKSVDAVVGSGRLYLDRLTQVDRLRAIKEAIPAYLAVMTDE